jgi:hypothetical protein
VAPLNHKQTPPLLWRTRNQRIKKISWVIAGRLLRQASKRLVSQVTDPNLPQPRASPLALRIFDLDPMRRTSGAVMEIKRRPAGQSK